MKVIKKISMFLIFAVFISASAFATWNEQFTAANPLSAVTGITGTNGVTLCAVGAGGTVLLSSNDYGNNWNSITAPIIGGLNLNAVSIFDNSIWVAGEGKVVFKSTDWGATWTPQVGQIPIVVQDIAFISEDKGVLVGYVSSPGISQGKVSYWNSVNGEWDRATIKGNVNPLSATCFSDSNTVWAVGIGGETWKSTDSGQTWNRVTLPTTDVLLDVFFIDASNGFVVGTNRTFIYTTDGGNNWIKGPDVGDLNLGVYFTDANTGWIVWQDTALDQSRITKANFSGSSWTFETQEIPAVTYFKSIYMVSNDHGFAVGTGTAGNGKIYSQLSSMTITSVVQEGTTLDRALRGFSGNLTVTGSGFPSGTWIPSMVSFSGSGININSVTRDSESQLTLHVSIDAAAALGARDFSITNAGYAILPDAFTVTAPPMVSVIIPPDGEQGATNLALEVQGTGFQEGIIADFGPDITVNSITYVSAFKLILSIDIDSNAATGQRNVTFTNIDGGSTDASFGVSSAASNPIIKSILPSSIPVGTTNQNVIISGSGFQPGATVSFGAADITINSTVVSPSGTEITVNIDVDPTAALGPRTVTVTNPDGGSDSINFALFITAPGIINPIVISVDRPGYQGWVNQRIFIYGQNFHDGAQVFFDDSRGITINDINFVSPNGIELYISIDQDAATGLRDVWVFNPDGGYGTGIDIFEILAQSSPPVVISTPMVYPNPWNPDVGPVNIQVNLSSDALLTVPFIDISGRKLAEFSINGTAGYNKIVWDGITYTGERVPNGMLLGLIIIQNKVSAKAKVLVVR